MNKEQERFWKILSNPFPKMKSCWNCAHRGPVAGGTEYPGATGCGIHNYRPGQWACSQNNTKKWEWDAINE